MTLEEAKAVAAITTIAVWHASQTLAQLQKAFPDWEWTYDSNRNLFSVGYPCTGPPTTKSPPTTKRPFIPEWVVNEAYGQMHLPRHWDPPDVFRNGFRAGAEFQINEPQENPHDA